MSTQRMTIGLSAIAVAACLAVSAEAGNNRSVVSTTGLDTNNCSVPAPCRSLAAALAATNANGEIIVLDSGGYGPATITQAVTITAPVGIRASVFIATSINGLTINTLDSVTIKGISFLGSGNGANGIEVDNFGNLYLDSVEVQDFQGAGIFSKVGAQLFISNSVVKECGTGLFVGAGSAYVRGSSFLSNATDGFRLVNGNAVVVDSVASFNGGNGAVAQAGTLHLLRLEAAFNGGAGIAAGAGTVSFEDTLSTRNTFAFDNLAGTLSGSSPGTSLLDGGSHGSILSAATGLQ